MVQWYNGTMVLSDKMCTVFPLGKTQIYLVFRSLIRTFANRMKPAIIEDIVLLHMTADYNPGTLARSIKRYFELNPYARKCLCTKVRKKSLLREKVWKTPISSVPLSVAMLNNKRAT